MAYSLLLISHICAGIVGLLSGAAAMVFRKGSRRHGLAGNVFVVAMLGLGVSAACLGLLIDKPGNFGGGFMTCYFVATAWATARRRDGQTSVFDWVGLLAISWFGAATIAKGFQAANGQAEPGDVVPAGMYYFLGSLMLLAGAGDLRMLVRGGVFGTQRIARHLWRMCFGLFIATGSFFFGQPQVFPAFLRGTYILPLLGILPLILLIFWLIRVRVGNGWRTTRGGSASYDQALAAGVLDTPRT